MIAAALALLLVGASAPVPAAVADGGVASKVVDPRGFQSRLDPEQVKLGEPFLYELVVTHLPGQRFELKRPADLGPFEILQVERSRKDGAAEAVTTFKVKLALFDLGKHRLPDLDFDVVEDGATKRFTAPGRDVEGLSTLPADAEEKGEALYDIEGPADVPVRSWRLLYVLAGLVAAGLLTWAVVKYLRRPRAQEVAVVPLLPAHVRAVQSLDALRAEDLPGQRRVREFYFRLSEILRGYLGERYGFDARESTTPELLEGLRKLHTPGLEMDALRRFALTSDFVKFAKYDSTPDECKEGLEFAYRLVDHTKPLPTPAGPKPDAVAHADRPDAP